MNLESTWAAINEIRGDLSQFPTQVQALIDRKIDKALPGYIEIQEAAFKKVLSQRCSEGDELGNAELTIQLAKIKDEFLQYKAMSLPEEIKMTLAQVQSESQRHTQEMQKLRLEFEEATNSNNILDNSLTPKVLKALFNSSGCTASEVSQAVNMSERNFYSIINGSEKSPDLLRLNNIKRYLKSRTKQNLIELQNA